MIEENCEQISSCESFGILRQNSIISSFLLTSREVPLTAIVSSNKKSTIEIGFYGTTGKKKKKKKKKE